MCITLGAYHESCQYHPLRQLGDSVGISSPLQWTKSEGSSLSLVSLSFLILLQLRQCASAPRTCVRAKGGKGKLTIGWADNKQTWYTCLVHPSVETENVHACKQQQIASGDELVLGINWANCPVVVPMTMNLVWTNSPTSRIEKDL
jgi:hypothetical protein